MPEQWAERYLSSRPIYEYERGRLAREVGEHAVTAEWECENCGASFDCLSQFRQVTRE